MSNGLPDGGGRARRDRRGRGRRAVQQRRQPVKRGRRLRRVLRAASGKGQPSGRRRRDCAVPVRHDGGPLQLIVATGRRQRPEVDGRPGESGHRMRSSRDGLENRDGRPVVVQGPDAVRSPAGDRRQRSGSDHAPRPSRRRRPASQRLRRRDGRSVWTEASEVVVQRRRSGPFGFGSRRRRVFPGSGPPQLQRVRFSGRRRSDRPLRRPLRHVCLGWHVYVSHVTALASRRWAAGGRAGGRRGVSRPTAVEIGGCAYVASSRLH